MAPRGGITGSVGACGLRGFEWAVERLNAENGIGGRKIEVFIEEETTPKDTIRSVNRLIHLYSVDVIQGVVSTGVSLALAPKLEAAKTLSIFWDGTTQDGVAETMPQPKYIFRSCDNECEAVMASLLAIKHYKGQFKRIAGMNASYSYGRNNWAAFQALLKKFGVDYTVVSEQWSHLGTTDLSSHVAGLKAAKPDLIFSSLLFEDLPIFMRQAHQAGLSATTKFVLPAAGWQHSALKKEFMPEGTVYGHNTMYFDHTAASPIQKSFVSWYWSKFQEYPHWEADRAYFALHIYKAGVEKAIRAKGGAWPSPEEIASAMEGVEIQSLGGRGGMRTDHIANQTYHQGLSTNKNRFEFSTLESVTTMYSDQLQKPSGGDFWDWLSATNFAV